MILGEKGKFRKYSKVPIYFLEGCGFVLHAICDDSYGTFLIKVIALNTVLGKVYFLFSISVKAKSVMHKINAYGIAFDLSCAK